MPGPIEVRIQTDFIALPESGRYCGRRRDFFRRPGDRWGRGVLRDYRGRAGDAGDFLIVNHGLAILDDGDHAAEQGDVVGLPYAALARDSGVGAMKP